MEKLKLPVMCGIPENNKWLSMDEYIKFVNFNAKCFRKYRIRNRKTDEMAMHVNVPFSIK